MANLKIFSLIPVILFCLLVTSVHAEMSSSNYRITSTVISGGGGTMSSASYNLLSTLGEPSPPSHFSSSNFQIYPRFLYTLLLITVGDINGDGYIGVAEAIMLLRQLGGL